MCKPTTGSHLVHCNHLQTRDASAGLPTGHPKRLDFGLPTDVMAALPLPVAMDSTVPTRTQADIPTINTHNTSPDAHTTGTDASASTKAGATSSSAVAHACRAAARRCNDDDNVAYDGASESPVSARA